MSRTKLELALALKLMKIKRPAVLCQRTVFPKKLLGLIEALTLGFETQGVRCFISPPMHYTIGDKEANNSVKQLQLRSLV